MSDIQTVTTDEEPGDPWIPMGPDEPVQTVDPEQTEEQS